MTPESDITKETKVNLFENLMVPVTTVKKKDTLLETVPNEVITRHEIIIQNKMLIKEKIKICLSCSGSISDIHLMMKIHVDGLSTQV